MKGWRRIPVDVIALVVIATVIILTHKNYIRRGLCFDDPSWMFHFGKKTLEGAVPYRDYVFQVGPLPIAMDALFQAMFGSIYRASLYASLLITILRVFVMWALVRRLADVKTAIGISAFCAFVSIFASQHHWSAQYAQLFITLAGLCGVLAMRSEGRRELVYLALAGACAALVVASRQSSAILVALALFACTTLLLVRKEYVTTRRYIALWGGYAAGIVLVFGSLAAVGALRPAIEQMFLEAASKKGVHGIDAVLDAISGGALVDGQHSWWGGLLFWLGLPIAIVAAMLYGLSRDRDVPASSVALLVIPGAFLLFHAQTFASLSFVTDLPRTLLTATTALAVLWPERLRRWLGVEPFVAVVLGALPLASDWAFEMSFPGRGWGDGTSLVTGSLLVVLASSRLVLRHKQIAAAALGAIGVLFAGVLIKNRANPFAQADAQDGTIVENRRVSTHPILDGMRVHAARLETIAWLTSVVTPGSTCFVYGNNPILYDIAGCTNPTRLDTTAGDFMSARDATEATDILRAHPPDFIIAHEQAWMNPPLSLDLPDRADAYDGLNPRASRAMHQGLRAIIDQYESLGTVGEALGPELAPMAERQRDRINFVRVYRRKR